MVQAELDTFLDSLGDRYDIPDTVLSFPGMTTSGEKTLLYRLARSYYKGRGVIIDAGLFLGASTNAFATGIRDNVPVYESLREHGIKPINSYEIALWSAAGFDKYLEHPSVRAALNGQTFEDGDNYFPVLARILSPHLDLIDFRIGDIEQLAHSDWAVEIAFYDCLKNYERDLAAFRAFAPNYIPEHTIIIQQDYFYEDALDNKIRQEFLAPYCSFLGGIATSAVFRIDKSFPSEFFGESDPVLSLSVDQRIKLLQNAAARMPLSQFSLYAELGAIRFMIIHGRFDQAEAALADVERTIAGTPLPPRPRDVATATRTWLEGQRR